jgi:formate dehydrogenase subunit gamma
LRHPRRRGQELAVGKYNAGQKLAAAAFGAAGVVFLGTGLMLLLPGQLHLSGSLRQGATIVHDATTLAFLALLLGHVRLALRHPESRRALRTGFMSTSYAAEHYPAWARDEQARQD